jgi:selenocysteine lyase/cysteine desulfurase
MRHAFGEDFDLRSRYLNTASIGVPSRSVLAAVGQAVQAWGAGGSQPTDFDADVAAARAGYASLIGVRPEDVAIGGSVSALAGLVAASLPDGARVVVAREEFTSVTFPFAAQADRGLTVTPVPLEELPSVAGAADVVAVSVVQSADGRIVDLDAVRSAVEGTRTLVLLDVTQAVGWLPLDLAWADAVVAGGYKWLLSPRGCAWMAISGRLLPRVRPSNANWYAGTDPWTSIYGLPLRLADGARRLDTSPAWFSYVGAAVALPWLASLDRAAVHTHCVALADHFLALLDLPPQKSAIVSVDLPGATDRLAAAGIVAAGRAGRARLAFHLYNDESDARAAANALTR